ncbi:hypothetical protein [Streptomyces globisporus]|uniref:hypothetical protein n=1 Tax=Streptomyces globisporus TaxID=1908 RepID=UPI00367FEA70
MTDKLTRTEMKLKAQENVASAICNVFAYVSENVLEHEIPEDQRDEFWEILEVQADRAVKVMGYEKHWKN